MSTASHSRQRKPQRVLVAGEPVFIHRRKDGAQGWCGPGVCALSEDPNPGRNETVWVHMRNCFHKCNRTRVRPATNEEAEGIETVTSLLPNLTEAVREGRGALPASLTRVILRTVRHWSCKAMSWTYSWEGQIRSRSLSSVNSNAPSHSSRLKLRLQPALTWKLESMIAGFDFEEREIHRDTIWTQSRTANRWRNRVGIYHDELRQVNLLFIFISPKQVRLSSNIWVQM